MKKGKVKGRSAWTACSLNRAKGTATLTSQVSLGGGGKRVGGSKAPKASGSAKRID